ASRFHGSIFPGLQCVGEVRGRDRASSIASEPRRQCDEIGRRGGFPQALKEGTIPEHEIAEAVKPRRRQFFAHTAPRPSRASIIKESSRPPSVRCCWRLLDGFIKRRLGSSARV